MSDTPSSASLLRASEERGWPELQRKVIRRQADGRVLWQPRISAWWKDKRFFGEPLPEPYEQLSVPDMFRHLGCSSRLYEFNACFRRVEHPKVRIIAEETGHHHTQYRFETPVGVQTAIKEQRPTCRLPMHVKREIETEEDVRVATWRAENAHYVFDAEVYQQIMEEWGDLGAPTMYMPRINIQDLYINTMGVERAILALYDWGPEVFRPYFDALDNLHDQLIDLLNSLPQFEIINFGDNLHASTLPPVWFEEFVLPAYKRRCERLHQGGKFVHAHWDGDVKPLLKYARQTDLDGIEAITPEPQGDVSFEEVKDALGDQVFLIDGVPAVYFNTTYSLGTLAESVHEIIELFSPNLILGISDEISSVADVERVRFVGQIVDEYNASLVTGR